MVSCFEILFFFKGGPGTNPGCMSPKRMRPMAVLLAVGLIATFGASPVAAASAQDSFQSNEGVQFNEIKRWWTEQPVEGDSAEYHLQTHDWGHQGEAYGVEVTSFDPPEEIEADETFVVRPTITNAGQEEVAQVTLRIRPRGSDLAFYGVAHHAGVGSGGSELVEYRVSPDFLPPGEYTVVIHTMKNGVVETAPLDVTAA